MDCMDSLKLMLNVLFIHVCDVFFFFIFINYSEEQQLKLVIKIHLFYLMFAVPEFN